MWLVVLLALTGCAVKPPLRYVAPDDTLHDVAYQPRRAQEDLQEQRFREGLEGAEAGPVDAPDRLQHSAADAARAHFATAVGLQGSCHHGEALAHYRGYLAAEPDGPYAARAMVRMAEIYLEPGFRGHDPDRARELLIEVRARFPESTAAAVACGVLPEVCAEP